ncbi:hypothetical protein HMPREF9380_2074 [Streptococcus sanguinis SK49]|uniref:Uncharacterized protein n=1 Tax=Streptococcus sanguinis SK49 TaxID=888808 RepID=F3UZY4_STRSA|nr:hypothetical protein [Streptococcus sanguinis]EGJ36187.1 hypothetical protein HMPREF9380_2074 [Streptococcus sanguinis SK49]
MEVLQTVIKFVGYGLNIMGALAILEGWYQYSKGKKNDTFQEQDKGQGGMVYGGMIIAGSGIILNYVANLISNLPQ